LLISYATEGGPTKETGGAGQKGRGFGEQESSRQSTPSNLIHSVNTDEKLLNHCNTKPTKAAVDGPQPTPLFATHLRHGYRTAYDCMTPNIYRIFMTIDF